jgi:hypothetical protein
MMADKGWKRAERMIAADAGGQRIPVTGERAGADVIAGGYCYQLKVRRSLPGWLFDWLGGIVSASKARPGSTGILVLNRPRQPRRNALVVLRWCDWVDIVGTPPVGEVQEPEAGDEAPCERADPDPKGAA